MFAGTNVETCEQNLPKLSFTSQLPTPARSSPTPQLSTTTTIPTVKNTAPPTTLQMTHQGELVAAPAPRRSPTRPPSSSSEVTSSGIFSAPPHPSSNIRLRKLAFTLPRGCCLYLGRPRRYVFFIPPVAGVPTQHINIYSDTRSSCDTGHMLQGYDPRQLHCGPRRQHIWDHDDMAWGTDLDDT